MLIFPTYEYLMIRDVSCVEQVKKLKHH